MIKKNRRSLITPQAPLVTDMDALSYIRYRPWADACISAIDTDRIARRYARAVYREEQDRLKELEATYFNGNGEFLRSPADWDYFFPEDDGLSDRQRKMVRRIAKRVQKDARFTLARAQDLINEIRVDGGLTTGNLQQAKSILWNFQWRTMASCIDNTSREGNCRDDMMKALSFIVNPIQIQASALGEKIQEIIEMARHHAD